MNHECPIPILYVCVEIFFFYITLPFFSATVAAKLKLRAETFDRFLLYHGYRELKLEDMKHEWQGIPTTQDWVCVECVQG